MPTDYTVLPMNVHFLHRRGTTAKINTYAGAAGEILIDLTKNTLVLPSGTAGTNYVLAREDRTITAGNGISLTVNGSVAASATLAENFAIGVTPSALIAPNDILTTDATTGKIKSDFSLAYDNTTGVFSVLAGDGTTVKATVTVPSHLSMLASATLEVASAGTPVNGAITGTFLHFVFNLSNGTTSSVYANVTDLIDIYTAGNGLTLTNGQFAAKVGVGLEVDPTNGIQVKVLSTENILKADGNGALYIDTTALTAATNQTIVSADTGNIVSAGSDGGSFLKLAASGNGLAVNDSGELIMPLDMGVLE